MGVLVAELTGCLKDEDRVGRGGGGISVFLGEGGLGVEDCADARVRGFRGDGGVTVDVVVFDGAETLLRVDEGFKVPGRIRLWRRVGTAGVAVDVVVAFVGAAGVVPELEGKEAWLLSSELVCCCLLGEISRGRLLSGGGRRVDPVTSSRLRLLRWGRRVRARGSPLSCVGILSGWEFDAVTGRAGALDPVGVGRAMLEAWSG